MKPISFLEWQKLMLEEMKASEKVECSECDGTGEVAHDCECSRCTADGDPCEACDETGYVAWGDLEHSDRLKYLTQARYEQAVLNDLTAVANWKGISVIELMVGLGYRVWSAMGSRRLKFEEQGA